MPSELPARTQADTPGAHIAQWLEHFRDRINLRALDEHATAGVRLLAGGRGADEFMDVLDPTRAARGSVLERLETAPGWMFADSATRCIVLCAGSGKVADSVLAPYASSSLPVFVLDLPERPVPDDAVLATAQRARPVRGVPARFYVSALDPEELGRYVLPGIVDVCRDVEIALAARLPIFRPIVAAKITVDCALTCLKVAGASALVDHVPVLGLVLGSIASAGDTVVITGFQIQMLLRIAASYGKKADFARIVELLPVIGGGYGWRALAREASGFIPFAGPVIKAGIAYAGTLVIGQAAAFYYETGDRMAPEKVRALYREAIERARNVAIDFVERLRKKSQ